MENRDRKSYFYTIVNERTGINTSDICCGFDYNEACRNVKTVVDNTIVEFIPEGEVVETDTDISFTTSDGSLVKFRYLDLDLYESLKGYMINYNAPILNSDEEVQLYIRQKSAMLS